MMNADATKMFHELIASRAEIMEFRGKYNTSMENVSKLLEQKDNMLHWERLNSELALEELRAEKDAEIQRLLAEKDAETQRLLAKKDAKIKSLRDEKNKKIRRVRAEKNAEIRLLRKENDRLRITYESYVIKTLWPGKKLRKRWVDHRDVIYDGIRPVGFIVAGEVMKTAD